MSKITPGHGTTLVATQPYQSISVYFSFSFMTSGESDRNTIYEGINGNFWMLITDHFNGMKHVDAIISKVYTISWLNNFLNQYSPTFNDKYIQLDQGG